MTHGASSNVCHACGIAVKGNVRHWCGMSRDDLHFRLRIPADLKDRVQAAAETNKRSMTAEIVAALEKEYPPSVALEEVARTIRLLEQM